ncbi:DnaA protein [Stella humosa]|uniref:DnaA protein n=1 Tax=Stella humosa TaxID=94 RepID=A0A3N1M1C0_9PROT|nr:DnaA/Hda family protein [Stella humosa]ROP99501.1 DnaA protein [Stella humosa]BBK31285.1 regulatory inactivation of DnaA Hda protein [Stella humosa]
MSGPRQLPLPLAHRPALAADDFLVAEGNRAAVAWLDRWPDWPAPALTIIGPEGAGKTHLARIFAERTGAPIFEGRRLARAALSPLVEGAPAAVVLDDGDQVPDWTILFHLYNILAGRAGHLLIMARSAPSRWPIDLPDLRSRLLTAPVAAIEPPGDELLAAVLAKHFSDRGIAVDPDVVGFLAIRIERSFAAAQSVVGVIDRHALAVGRRITLPLVRAALPELVRDADDRRAGLESNQRHESH